MMFFNLIHRSEAPNEATLDAFRFQLDAAHKHGLKSTNLMSYLGFLNPKVVDEVRAAYEKHGDEIGIHLHEYQCPEFRKRIPTQEYAFWLCSQPVKLQIIDLFMELFEKNFGFLPASIGSYYIDAQTLGEIKKRYPSVRCVIPTCFQEGSNMFRGTQSNWHLFNEGGPWWPWWPSKEHVLCPAKDRKEAIDVVALPHLVRDMVMSINDRNDYFSSHPGNMLRGKAYDGPATQYDANFIDAYLDQERYNGGYSYYNMFVSLPWLASKHAFEEATGSVKKFYLKNLKYLSKLRDEGRLVDCTMQEFADWFSRNRVSTPMDSCYWEDILCGSGREAFWQVGTHYRACLDSHLGGAVCDLRPYAGRLERPTGPDGKGMWTGSYPFLFNSHKRGGFLPRYNRGSMFGTALMDGDTVVNLCEYRIPMKSFDKKTETLTFEPVEVSIGNGKVKLQNRYRFAQDSITLETTVLRGLKGRKIRVVHYLAGGPGTTEYPEDIRGVKMSATGARERATLDVQYASAIKEVKQPKLLKARVPQLNLEVSLQPVGKSDVGSLEDEYLFSPYFNLALSSNLTTGGKVASCLKLQKL